MLNAVSEMCALKLALDVLQTISLQLRTPDRVEAANLRDRAQSKLERSLPADELACLLVHRELARRAESSMACRPERAA
jgi:hypothetical protein